MRGQEAGPNDVQLKHVDVARFDLQQFPVSVETAVGRRSHDADSVTRALGPSLAGLFAVVESTAFGGAGNGDSRRGCSDGPKEQGAKQRGAQD